MKVEKHYVIKFVGGGFLCESPSEKNYWTLQSIDAEHFESEEQALKTFTNCVPPGCYKFEIIKYYKTE